jgi:hypothetical protein
MKQLINQVKNKHKEKHSCRKIPIRTKSMDKDKRQRSEYVSAKYSNEEIGFSEKYTKQKKERKKIHQRRDDISNPIYKFSIRQKKIRISNAGKWISTIIGSKKF